MGQPSSTCIPTATLQREGALRELIDERVTKNGGVRRLDLVPELLREARAHDGGHSWSWLAVARGAGFEVVAGQSAQKWWTGPWPRPVVYVAPAARALAR